MIIVPKTTIDAKVNFLHESIKLPAGVPEEDLNKIKGTLNTYDNIFMEIEKGAEYCKFDKQINNCTTKMEVIILMRIKGSVVYLRAFSYRTWSRIFWMKFKCYNDKNVKDHNIGLNQIFQNVFLAWGCLRIVWERF